VPGAYTSGGVLSLTGAAVVAAATVVLSYAVNAVLGPILV
jgi:hypothetical protein